MQDLLHVTNDQLTEKLNNIQPSNAKNNRKFLHTNKLLTRLFTHYCAIGTTACYKDTDRPKKKKKKQQKQSKNHSMTNHC